MKQVILCVAFSSLLVCVLSECLDNMGREREDGETYMGPDRCNQCRCLNGTNACTKVRCEPGHVRCMGPKLMLTEGESYDGDGGCCTCTKEAEVVCTDLPCSQEKREGL